MTDPHVIDDAGADRYTIEVDGRVVGRAEYTDVDGVRVFTHTEIEDGHEGEGLGGALVAGAMEEVASRGMPIVPLCPFVASWLERHPEHAGVVADDVDAVTRRFLEEAG